jgi:hypothetical protein
MEPERLRQVEQLYHAALEGDRDQRGAYLKETCADEMLRREVEGLLAYEEQARNFIGMPALEIAALQVMESGQAREPARQLRLTAGDGMGPYEIVKPLGAGGTLQLHGQKW